jgi:hypothetical protein
MAARLTNEQRTRVGILHDTNILHGARCDWQCVHLQWHVVVRCSGHRFRQQFRVNILSLYIVLCRGGQ